MALSSGTLASGIEAMTPTDNEGAAISSFVSAFESYFAQATVNGVPLVAGSVAAGLSAMQGAMSGLSASGQGAAKIAAGVSAFWTAQLSLATTMWVTAPVVLVPPIVPPAGLSGLQAALEGVFASNLVAELELGDAAAAVASAIHTANQGGAVPGSVPPAAPAPIVIL